MAILAVMRMFSTLHTGLHALCYGVYSAAREDWDEVARWARPYCWIIEDQLLTLIAVGQLVL